MEPISRALVWIFGSSGCLSWISTHGTDLFLGREQRNYDASPTSLRSSGSEGRALCSTRVGTTMLDKYHDSSPAIMRALGEECGSISNTQMNFPEYCPFCT